MPSIGLNIGLKALLTSQAGLDSVGHNISNAATPGYTRQRLDISADQAITVRGLALGNGVSASVILRMADALVQRRLVTQQASISSLEERLNGMAQVESLFGEPGPQGLDSLMQGFYSSLSSLAADPQDQVLQGGAVQAAQGLQSRFNDLSKNLGDVRKQNGAQVTAQVGQVNVLTGKIATLNREIAIFESSGSPANDLRDQREQSLADLAKLVNISYSEGSDGNVTVLTNGALLVGTTKAYALATHVAADGSVTLTVANNPRTIEVKGGTIGGLLHVGQGVVPDLLAKLDTLAHNLILAMNRAHSTGMPGDGPFKSLTGTNRLQDTNQDGDLTDELLADAGLPFEVQQGSLYVNVSNTSDHSFTTTRIDVDPATTTVQDLLDALNAIPHMSASLDNQGRVQLSSAQGYGFDFSRRLNPAPDPHGTLGGASASLGTASSAPFNLANGDTLTVTGPTGALSVTLNAADFVDITQATADELAAAINADPSTAASGMQAVAQGDHLFLQSLATGTAASFTVTGGSALAALGWTASTVVSGQANSVDVQLSGTYTGSASEQYTFVPSGDGVIGTTPGLKIDVFDSEGQQVTSLDVGQGYQPGTPLTLANGIQVRFGFGSISATDQDRLTVDALADSDTADVLVGLGLNALFTGTDASDIAVNEAIVADPSQLSTSVSGAPSDNSVLNALLATRQAPVADLGAVSFGEYYGGVVGGVGFEIDSTNNSRDVEQSLFDSLQNRREQAAGVNIDEELVNMIQFQQSFAAASRFITVVNSTSDEVLRLL